MSRSASENVQNASSVQTNTSEQNFERVSRVMDVQRGRGHGRDGGKKFEASTYACMMTASSRHQGQRPPSRQAVLSAAGHFQFPTCTQICAQ